MRIAPSPTPTWSSPRALLLLAIGLDLLLMVGRALLGALAGAAGGALGLLSRQGAGAA